MVFPWHCEITICSNHLVCSIRLARGLIVPFVRFGVF